MMQPQATILLLSLLSFAQQGCVASCSSGCHYGARVYSSGASFPSEDGCNTCSCEPTGDVVCTERACAPDGGVDVVMCTGAQATFPKFSKQCQAASDCAIGLHQYDCCGSQRALGIAMGDLGRFRGDEAICRSQYPGCGCPTGPTQAEDGKTALDPAQIVVACTLGACTTSVP